MLIEPSKQLADALANEKSRLIVKALKQGTYQKAVSFLSTANSEYSGVLEAGQYDWATRYAMMKVIEQAKKEVMDIALSRESDEALGD